MRSSLDKFVLAGLFMLLAANFLAAQTVLHGNGVRPDGKGGVIENAAPTGQSVTTGNGINYNGGPVLKASPVPIYIIWYGNWNGGARPSDSQATVTLLEGFLSSTSLGGSSYEAINTLYGDTT